MFKACFYESKPRISQITRNNSSRRSVACLDFIISRSGALAPERYHSADRLQSATLQPGIMAGNYRLSWNAAEFPSGMYFYQFQTDGFS